MLPIRRPPAEKGGRVVPRRDILEPRLRKLFDEIGPALVDDSPEKVPLYTAKTTSVIQEMYFILSGALDMYPLDRPALWTDGFKLWGF